MEKNKVSVVVPCYNQSQYLAEAIESIVKQTYTNWECIIVNDGSPDNTEEVALQLCQRDSRLKYLYKDNGGLSDARNFGIKNSIGIYILPLDCDDKIGENYLKKAVEILDNNNEVQLVYANAEFFDGKSGKWKLPDYSYDLLLLRNMIYCSAIYRRERYEKTIGYNPNMKYGSEDWDFWLSIIKLGGEVYKLSSIEFYYRQRNSSMLTDLKANRLKMQKMQEQVYNNHKDIYDKLILENGGIISILHERHMVRYTKLSVIKNYISSLKKMIKIK